MMIYSIIGSLVSMIVFSIYFFSFNASFLFLYVIGETEAIGSLTLVSAMAIMQGLFVPS